MVISEFNAVMGVVTDSLRSLPATLDPSEKCPSLIRQLFGVAVSAGQQEGEHVLGQIGDVPLLRCGAHFIRQAAVLYNKLAANFDQPCRYDEPGADVAIGIKEVARVYAGRKLHRLIAENVSIARRVRGEHQHHGNRIGTLKCNVVACPNFHKSLLEISSREKRNALSSFQAGMIEN